MHGGNDFYLFLNNLGGGSRKMSMATRKNVGGDY